jgi:carbon storage regulator
MLVLSRKNGECVQIGDSIEVKVLEVSGGRVKLGFCAPPNVSIQRNEIRDGYLHAGQSWEESSVILECCIP